MDHGKGTVIGADALQHRIHSDPEASVCDPHGVSSQATEPILCQSHARAHANKKARKNHGNSEEQKRLSRDTTLTPSSLLLFSLHSHTLPFLPFLLLPFSCVFATTRTCDSDGSVRVLRICRRLVGGGVEVVDEALLGSANAVPNEWSGVVLQRIHRALHKRTHVSLLRCHHRWIERNKRDGNLEKRIQRRLGLVPVKHKDKVVHASVGKLIKAPARLCEKQPQVRADGKVCTVVAQEREALVCRQRIDFAAVEV